MPKKLDPETSAMMMDMQLSNIAHVLDGEVKHFTGCNRTHKWKKIEIVYDYGTKEDT
tara:strand:- start:877 stop:1047 length:171 start_codon:yes stop_codon:yes gene_type:complete